MKKLLLIPLFCAMALAQIGGKAALGGKAGSGRGLAAGGAAPTFVQACMNGGTAANTIDCGASGVAFPGNVTIGDCIVCVIEFGSGTLTSITDAAAAGCNGTWTLLDNNTSIAGGNRVASMAMTVSTATGVCTPRATFPSSVGVLFYCHQVHGAAASPLDQHQIFDPNSNQSWATANSLTSGTAVTDTFSNDYVFGWILSTGVPTFVAGTSPLTFTLRENFNGNPASVLQSEDAVASGTSAQATGSGTGTNGFGSGGIVTLHP